MFWYGSTKYIRVLSIDGWNELDDDVRAVVVLVVRTGKKRCAADFPEHVPIRRIPVEQYLKR